MKLNKVVFMLFIILLIPSISLAETFTDYQANLKFDPPEGWNAEVVNGSKHFIGLNNILYKETPIIIYPHAITDFQTEAKFINIRTFLNWPNNELAESMEKEIKSIKNNDVNAQILLSQIITSYNNKSIFIIYENNNFRQLQAVTLINGIRYDIFTRIKTINRDQTTEKMTPVFIELIKSIRPAY